MRETFDSLGQLMGFYRFILLKVSTRPSPAGAMLHKAYEDIDNQLGAKVLQGSMEDKLAFIADVERYVEYYRKQQKGSSPLTKDILLAIFHLRFCPDVARYHSYNHMAECIRRENRRRQLLGDILLPRRLQHRHHIIEEGKSLHEQAEKYFEDIGMILTEM